MAFDIWQLATHDLAEVATTPAATPATAPCHRFDLPMPEDFAGYTINLHMRSDIEQRDYLWPCESTLHIYTSVLGADVKFQSLWVSKRPDRT